jgi:hypothetical protein
LDPDSFTFRNIFTFRHFHTDWKRHGHSFTLRNTFLDSIVVNHTFQDAYTEQHWFLDSNVVSDAFKDAYTKQNRFLDPDSFAFRHFDPHGLTNTHGVANTY